MPSADLTQFCCAIWGPAGLNLMPFVLTYDRDKLIPFAITGLVRTGVPHVIIEFPGRKKLHPRLAWPGGLTRDMDWSDVKIACFRGGAEYLGINLPEAIT